MRVGSARGESSTVSLGPGFDAGSLSPPSFYMSAWESAEAILAAPPFRWPGARNGPPFNSRRAWLRWLGRFCHKRANEFNVNPETK